MKILLILSFALIMGCVSVPPGGGGALIYNNFRAPYKTFPVKLGNLTSESSAHCILSIACFGDITISSTARKKGIVNVTTIEYEFFNISFLYSRTTIIVLGIGEAKNE